MGQWKPAFGLFALGTPTAHRLVSTRKISFKCVPLAVTLAVAWACTVLHLYSDQIIVTAWS